MSAGSVLKSVLLGLGFVIAVSMAFGALVGQPVGVSYVETGSMSPALEPNDGFVAIPSQIAGPVEEGDVIVFDAEELHGGGLVTHRVVGETDEGYITRGDANPVTDQDGAEPPVQDDQIKAKALQIGGTIVVIPQIGVPVVLIGAAFEFVQVRAASALGTRALLGTQGLVYMLFGFGAITYVLASLVENTDKRNRSRQSSRSTGAITPQTVIIAMVAILLVVVTLSMVIPGGSHQFHYVSSEADSENPGVIQQGTTENVTYLVPSNGPFPVVSVVEPTSDRIEVAPAHVSVAGGETGNVTVTIHAPPETGSYTDSITEHRYLGILPEGTILTLHGIHPWAPIVVINTLLGSFFVVVSVILIGIDPIRLSRRDEPLPWRVRLRRWLK